MKMQTLSQLITNTTYNRSCDWGYQLRCVAQVPPNTVPAHEQLLYIILPFPEVQQDTFSHVIPQRPSATAPKAALTPSVRGRTKTFCQPTGRT